MIPTSSNGPEGITQSVHALVLTWNGAPLLSDCLKALLPQRARVVVVDNASTDGTAELLQRDFPQVEHLRLGENFGYGRANNEGLRRALEAGAEFVALVNNDVEVGPEWLARLREAARAQPRAGLFTGTLLFKDEERVNSTGLAIDGFGRARDRDFRLPLEQLQRSDGPVAGVSGGAALLRVSMLREIGLFDEAYFAYYEDVDLSLRAAEAGWTSWYVREAWARHRFGASFGPGSPIAAAALPARARPSAHAGLAPAAAQSRGAGAAHGGLSRGVQGAARDPARAAGAGLGRAARGRRRRGRGAEGLQR